MSTPFTQSGRFLNLETSLAPNTLLLTSFTAKENISNLFDITLNMISNDTNIDSQKLIHKPATIKINASNSEPPRYFNGIVKAFTGGRIEHGHRFYYAKLIPWLGLLNFTNDYRIFQHKTVIEITKQIFTDFNFHDFDTSALTQAYKKRDYCVQYNETTSHFLERIWAESGIFYFFTHQNNKHLLVLADNSSTLKNCVTDSVVFDDSGHKSHCLSQWSRQQQFYSGKSEKNDYNFETPDTHLHSPQSATAKLSATQKYSLYHYPAGHMFNSDGKTIAQHHFEAQEVKYDTAQGEGNYANFATGGKFNFAEPALASDAGDYIITQMIHTAGDESYLKDGAQFYHNLFACIPAKTPIRTTRNKKPIITGSQSAIVVGPTGEEIHTDNYGRIKVQFHWDRKGEKNEHSSCWVRVAQMWAGNKWGTLFLPRIGQEVIVHFLDGDPDRPVVIGALYNANNMPPYDLPYEKTQSGIKTKSTKDASSNNYNELRFEDKIGKEEIHIQAEKDYTRLVKHDETAEVKHDKTETVGNDKIITVNNDQTITIQNNCTETIGKNKTVIIKGNHTMTIPMGTCVIQASELIELNCGPTSLLITPMGVYIKSANFEVDK